MYIKASTQAGKGTRHALTDEWLEQRQGASDIQGKALMDLDTPAKRWRSCVCTANGKFVSS